MSNIMMSKIKWPLKVHSERILETRKYESKTNKGVFWTTSVYTDGRAICDCPAGSFSKNCWHKEDILKNYESIS